MSKLSLNIRIVLLIHAGFSILYGVILILMPHGFYEKFGVYNYMTHESSRLYGCLTIGISWLTYSTRNINDGRLIKSFTESFSVAYILQALVMLRALITNLNTFTTHSSAWHTIISLIFLSIGGLYLYVRLTYKSKDYELPGGLRDS